MRNRKLRVLSLLLALAMMIGLFAGCSSNTGDDQKTTDNTGKENVGGDDKNTTTKDSIIIATMSETPSVHPCDHNATAGSYMNQLTYSTLFVSDMELVPQPNLVDTYEI